MILSVWQLTHTYDSCSILWSCDHKLPASYKQSYSTSHSAFVHPCTYSVNLVAFVPCLSGHSHTLLHLAATIPRPSILVLCFSCHPNSLPEPHCACAMPPLILMHPPWPFVLYGTSAPLSFCCAGHLCILPGLLHTLRKHCWAHITLPGHSCILPYLAAYISKRNPNMSTVVSIMLDRVCLYIVHCLGPKWSLMPFYTEMTF